MLSTLNALLFTSVRVVDPMDDVLQSEVITNKQHYALLIGISISLYLLFTSKTWKLRHIPTAGFSGWPLLSFVSTVQFIWRGDDLLREYHERYQGKPFKIAHLTGWFVVLNSGPEDVKEASRWSESVAQLYPVLQEVFLPQLTIGPISSHEHHVVALVNRLTRNISNITSEMRDELVSSIDEVLPPTDEWKSYKLEAISMPIVCRVVARMIVGEDLCKNKKFLDICLEFPKQVFKTAATVTILFPSVLKPLAPRLLKGTSPLVNSTIELITPIVEKSQFWRPTGSTNQEKSKTSLDWIIDMADGDEDEYSMDSMARRILQLSLASLHTSSITFQRVLYNLSHHPEYITAVRDEAQQAVSQHGWSKIALDQMKKLESIIQESNRLMPLSNFQPARMMMKDHILHDGTFLPQGTTVTFRTDSIHMDDTVYPDPDRFDGLRFFNMNQGQKKSFTTPDQNNVTFGIGRLACPGRFIALMEIKLLISYLLLNYDVKVGKSSSNSGILPRYEILKGNPHVPKDYGELLIRKRRSNADA